MKPGLLFWIIAILFLLWNLLGCTMYLFDAFASTEQYTQAYGAEMSGLRDAYPALAMAGYAVGVWGGLVAAILFLLRKRLGAALFIVSFLGALVSNVWTVTSPVVKEVAGGTHWVMPLVITLIGIFEIWYSRQKAADGTLS